jgi:hypothetical protein
MEAEFASMQIEEKHTWLIGLTGEIGCGKSLAASYLCRKYGAIEYTVAQPLKDVAIVMGFEPRQVYGTQAEKSAINPFWGISGRTFLQQFGTEVCRQYLPVAVPGMRLNGFSVWVRLMELFCERNRDTNIIVSDIRFPDECKKIKELGGIIIKIDRPRVGVEMESRHASETQHIPAHIIVSNNGTIDELYAKLDRAMTAMMTGLAGSPAIVYI